MMTDIIEIDINNCKFCWEATMGRILANPSLPIGKRIIGLNFHLNDSRISNVREQKEVFLPMLMGYEKSGHLINKHEPRFSVISVLDFTHMKTFLKEMYNIL